jgi:hypothetical protein
MSQKVVRRALGMVLPSVVLGLVGWGGASGAAVLVSDNFDDVALGTGLSGRMAPVDLPGNPWVASTTSFLGNGAGGVTADTTQVKSASIDFGANYLSNNPGIYDISADLTQPSGGTGSSWIAVGLELANDVGQNFVVDKGAPWVLYRYNGQVVVFGGPANAPTLVTTTATTGTAHSFKLELDTTGAAWTLNGFLDGAPMDLNGAAAGETYTYTSNPVGAHYVGLSTGLNGAGAIATADNVQLAGPLPEPSGALVMLAGLGLMGGSRRRRSVRR